MALKGTLLKISISALTCTSFLLIGYDNGVLGGVIEQPAFQATFKEPGPTLIGLIVSLYEAGCFIGAICCAVFGEKLGRCKSMALGGVVMLIGALLQATAYTRSHIIIARIVCGIGMGFINSTAPVYQSEFAPAASRGIYACAMLSTLNLGIFLSYWIGYGFAGITPSFAWRVPVILQCIFIIPIIGLALLLPETPRWLIAHDHMERARDVLLRMKASDPDPDAAAQVMQDRIYNSVVVENDVKVKGLKGILAEDEIKSRRRLLIACAIQFFQQLGGINGIIYYAGTIFTAIGFSTAMSSLMSGFLFTWFFVASFITWFLIDRIGRRPLLLVSISVMAAVFAVMTGLSKQIQEGTSIATASGVGAASVLFVYMGAFTIGFQATVWVYPPEILPLRLRQVGTALATASNWATNFMVVMVTPPGISNIGWRYYIIYAVFNACFVPIIYLFFPETKGMELEDVDNLFASPEVKEALKDMESHEGRSEFIEHKR